MNSLDKFCLKWNDFTTNISTSLKEFKDDQKFSDVTLATADKQAIKAHKVVLAASSPVFKNLLRQNNHPHPLIYLKSVPASRLE